MTQSLAIPRVIPEDWKRLDLIINKIKFHLGSASSPTFAGITVTGLTASTLIGADASKALESVTIGTGLDYTRPTLSLSHLGIEDLTDPGSDKILFWDDSATACKWLGMGNSIAITDVTIDTIQDIRTSASPTFAGLTLTNAAVISSDSVVFQPNTDSTTFLQVLDADGGTPILNVDTTNERVGIGTATPGMTLDVENTTIGANTPIAYFEGSEGRFRFFSDNNFTRMQFNIQHDATPTRPVFTTSVVGESYSRFAFSNSSLLWGPGSTDHDTDLYRAGVDRLRTSDSLTIDGNLSVGVVIPKTRLTVEGALTLKELPGAAEDTAAYGQVWVKNDTPCSLWYTGDTGVDRLVSGANHYVTDADVFHHGDSSNYTAMAADGSQSFAGTARIDWTKITANGATIRNAHGTTGSSVSDLQTAHDGNFYTLSEESGETPGMDIEVDFTGVTAFNWVQILARYEQAVAGHGITIMLEITPFNGSAWHRYDFMCDQGADLTNEEHSFFIPDDSVYINSGVVKVRFVHEMIGTSANHDLVIDTVALYQ